MRRTGYQRRQTGGSGRTAARPPGRIRIIAGRFRGRRIPVADLPGLRPTPERTRETLFNWLQGELHGARVLDMFAGSGALGFEALSRGAASVVLLEKDRRVCRQLVEVAESLDRERCQVLQADALNWPRTSVQAFDLILIDPPFASGLAVAALAHVHSRGLLTTHAKVYCEVSSQESPPPWKHPDSGTWQVLKETRAGDSLGALLAAAAEPTTEPPESGGIQPS
ncbi:MAG: 16S rRNA (guanine(966)-N(2))-methyltransferase RsmD [Gammaproteobacteria bacterium]|nr:16S rRNA (guanine(966)-N(2))-methyltransferase RsmD [Gammaproteobacteria bacterium]